MENLCEARALAGFRARAGPVELEGGDGEPEVVALGSHQL
jgi:hypothetical protein